MESFSLDSENKQILIMNFMNSVAKLWQKPVSHLQNCAAAACAILQK